MITVTEKAQEKIGNYFKDKPKAPVRIQVAEGCCGGPYLAIVLDEIRQDDTRYEAEGLTYVISKDLADHLGRISIDFLEKDGMTWFQVTPENPLPTAQEGPKSCCT